MKVVRYVAPGSRMGDETAQVIGEYLEQRFGDKPRTAADVVAAARPQRSPLHRFFEWDDGVAAEKYREAQARLLLRTIEVVLTTGDEERGPTRAFHNVAILKRDGVANAYVPAVVVWEKPDLADQVRDNAKRELATWANRYKEYKELGSLVEKVNQILLELG